jgi:hypothetical protein
LNPLSGSAAGNYGATLSTAGNTLTILPSAATVIPGLPAPGSPGVPTPGLPPFIPGPSNGAGGLPGAIAGGQATGVASVLSVSPFLGPIIQGINLSALDPNPTFGAGGSSIVAEGAPGFFETLPPTAAGPADGEGSSASNDGAPVSIGEESSRRCFDAQPLAQLWCRRGR